MQNGRGQLARRRFRLRDVSYISCHGGVQSFYWYRGDPFKHSAPAEAEMWKTSLKAAGPFHPRLENCTNASGLETPQYVIYW